MPDVYLHGAEVIEIDDGFRPIQTVKSSIIGLIGTAPDADVAKFPANTPVLCAGPRQAADLGATGTLKDAYAAIHDQGAKAVVVIRVEAGVDEAGTLANIVGDATAMTGVWGFMAAESVLHLTPRILCAPGWTSQRPGDAANPVVVALTSIADRLRAVVVADGPNTTEADALTYRADHGSDRVFIVDPAVTVFDTETATNVVRPASGFVAGLIAATDLKKGFWWSPSNQVLGGVTGAARPVAFALSDPDTEANRLNEGEVATVVHQNGYRLWGNRSAATDTLWAFLNVRRTADMIYESIERNHLWAMDRPFSAQLVKDIEGGVREYFRTLKALGAILGGNVWLDPELNSETQLKAGKLFLNFDFEPPAPLEHLTFRAYRNGSYYDELVEEVANA